MATKTGDPAVDSLYSARRGHVEFVDVPELGYLMVDGMGAPGGPQYTEAIRALFAVSYGAHFALKKELGSAPRVLPLETLWWLDDAGAQASLEHFAMGAPAFHVVDRSLWRWRAMIPQLSPVDGSVVDSARAAAAGKATERALGDLRFQLWTEGSCAQLLHVGPYDAEADDIQLLMRTISEHGLRPRGRHHEIYLGDPRRSAPEGLRTIIRHPVG